MTSPLRIVGIDEVGRGAWAGPLVAAAVILGCDIDGLNDSKKLSVKRRHSLAVEIHSRAQAVGIGWVQPEEVDQLGLTQSVALAMHRALQQINGNYEHIIIDGNYNFLQHVKGSTFHNVSTLVGADAVVPEVSAASIVAKVARDKYMAEQAKIFPVFGFELNVGYGTKVHTQALSLHGPTRIHRKSYKPIQVLL